MGDLFSLFWEVESPPIPLSFTIPSQDYECRKDDSCGTVGSFLLWYFVIILVLMFLSRASVWMSESRRDEDSGTNASGSKDKETPCKRQSKDTSRDASQMTKKPKQNQLALVTDSEVALVNAYLEQRRARLRPQSHWVNQVHHDSDTTECDSDKSNSGTSSWKESESEQQPSLGCVKRRKTAQRQRNLETFQIRERPCPHCKAMRTNEWLARHFLQNASAKAPMMGGSQEESSTPDINTKLSKF